MPSTCGEYTQFTYDCDFILSFLNLQKNSNHPLHALFLISKIEVETQQCCSHSPYPCPGPSYCLGFFFVGLFRVVYLFIYLFIYSFIYSIIYWLIYSFIHSFIYLSIYPFIYSVYLLAFLFSSRKPNVTCPLSHHFFSLLHVSTRLRKLYIGYIEICFDCSFWKSTNLYPPKLLANYPQNSP